jgi:hypothetical protein
MMCREQAGPQAINFCVNVECFTVRFEIGCSRANDLPSLAKLSYDRHRRSVTTLVRAAIQSAAAT